MQTSKYLFQYRAVIAVFFFIILVIFARPITTTIAHIIISIGLAIRIWAAGYIGPTARKREFTAEYIISNGPYRYIKHPLYIGNFFLVLGVLGLFNPSRWLFALYIAAFIIMYADITVGEKQYLEKKVPRKVPYRLRNLKGELSTLLIMCLVYIVYFVEFALRLRYTQ